MTKKNQFFLIQEYRKKKFILNFLKFILKKFMYKNSLVSTLTQLYFFYKYIYFTKFYSKTLHKNICFLTGKKKSILTLFNLQRNMSMYQTQNLKYPGLFLDIF